MTTIRRTTMRKIGRAKTRRTTTTRKTGRMATPRTTDATRTRGLLVMALLSAAVACGGQEPSSGAAAPPEVADAADLAPDAGFDALEDALVDGPPVRIAFDVTAEGSATADLTGTLTLGEGGRVRLEASGRFVDAEVDVVLISDGERVFWTGSPFEDGKPTPAALREALGVGFTRMGILHNLARLSVGQAPDHEDGGVEAWVTVSATDERGMLEGAPAGAAERSVVRAITVDGYPSGTFALELEGRVPRVRRQVVEFPQGIMRVVERYPTFEFPADLPPGTFDTTPLDIGR
jgi:hypothetical protein